MPWHKEHATGLTIVLLGALCIGLGLAPIPDRFKPFDLTSKTELVAMKERVLRRPKLTLTKPAPDPAEDVKETKEPTAVASLVPVQKKGDSFARPRDALVATTEVKRLRKVAKQLKANGSTIENHCIIKAKDGSCEKTALDNFFASLDDVVKKESGANATVVTLGNSLIASDHVTDVVRERLVENFGSAGRGFLLPDRLSKLAGRRVRTGRGTDGWTIHTFAQKRPARTEFGFAGSMHESTKSSDRIRWRLRGATKAQLFWLDHKDNPGFTLYAGKKKILDVPSTHPEFPEDRITDIELPSGATDLVLHAGGKGVVLYGVALLGDEPGVVWDTIGVPASDAVRYMAVNEKRFVTQLGAREPSLVVVMIGGNETRSLAFKWTTIDAVEEVYRSLLQRVKKAAPTASCLAVSPIDAAKATAAGAKLTTRPQVKLVVAMERRVAQEEGCAFFNLFEAMGGDGSLHRFNRKNLVNADLVHPKGDGGDVMGQLFADALLEAYRVTPLPKVIIKSKKRLVRPRLLALDGDRPEDQMHNLFAKLSDLQNGSRKRVAVGVFGDRLVEDELLVERMRHNLQNKFGNAGRGYVAFGNPSPSLLESRITRRLAGRYEVTDGREVRRGGALSMSGHKVRLSPGARTKVTFCDGCTAKERQASLAGTLEIAWLYTPGSGIADVYVNDVWVGALSPQQRRQHSDVQFFRVPIRGRGHSVVVQVRDPDANPDTDGPFAQRIAKNAAGPIHLFGIVSESNHKGVVVDTVGARDTTAMTMQRWRKDVIAAQVNARTYDLVMTFWGEREANLKKLDQVTYLFHARKTLRTILDASPSSSCIIASPPDEGAQSFDMVDDSLRIIASENGCAYFDLARLLRDKKSWQEQGLMTDTGDISRDGADRLGDFLTGDIINLYDYLQSREAEILLAKDGK